MVYQIQRSAKRIKRWFDYDYSCLQASPDFIDMFAHDDNNDGSDVVLSEVIPDHLLAAEILPRLADARAASRASAVSKLWRSLITADDFIPNFCRRRRSSHAMFVEFRFQLPKSWLLELCAKHLLVRGSEVTAGVTAYYDIERSPFGGRHELVFDSVCDEFMLFSTPVNKDYPVRRLYIRNSVTRQWLELPKLPLKDQGGFCALVSRPPDSALSRYSFRVVYHNLISSDDNDPLLHCFTVFSSETGQWSETAAAPEIRQMPAAVATNGLLFLLYIAGATRLLIFDAFGDESWRFVDLPIDLLLPQQFYNGLSVEFGPADEVEQLGSFKGRPIIGAVQGQLRLAQLFKVDDGRGYFVTKIWELCDRYSNNEMWRLVSEVKLRAPPAEGKTKWLYLFALDPEDNDVVFLCCDSEVHRYCISSGEYQYVFQLQCTNNTLKQSAKDSLPRFAQVFTVKLPPWPSSIPTIPSSSTAI